MRIGIDVGGTNTDAVLMDGAEVAASHKASTSPDVMTGIKEAMSAVLAGKDRSAVKAVMLGTTHFANALVERKELNRTAVVRLGAPYGGAVPPFCDFPEELAEVLQGPVFLVAGGYEFDGQPIAELDEEAIRQAGLRLKAEGIATAVVSGPFSVVNDDMERRAAELLALAHPALRVTMSSEIGTVGLLERENAAILNACMLPLADRIAGAFKEALNSVGLDCPYYLTQNDGTLMTSDYAKRFPVLTISSGPTNSMRGAAYLSGLKDAIVIDIGGTTSDIGVLVNGFPRTASTALIAGVKTNFRIPDVYCLGLGGGTYVRRGEDGALSAIGPDSAGYRIRSEAYSFGGDRLTMSDVIVAAGAADIGTDRALVPLESEEAWAIIGRASRMLEESVDRMKPGKEAFPAIAVGGGSILIAQPLTGLGEVIKPDHYAVANAIGAAIAQVGGEIDKVFSLEGTNRESIVKEAKNAAIARAVEAGADEARTEIVAYEEFPLSYLPGQATRIRVKAIGDVKGAVLA